ncbi:MAG: hypothetical protein JRF37_05955 [Deltaproteobacteria bacterium]|nr:hypothetical protein [Deltaproteobacteria bacterium]
MLIDSGLVERKVSGRPVYLIEPTELKAVIESGYHNQRILEMIQENNSTNSFGDIDFKAQVQGGTNVLKVSTNAKNPDLGSKALLNLHELLQQEYSGQIKYLRAKKKAEEKANSRELLVLSKEKMLRQERIKELEVRTSELVEEIKTVSAEIELLTEKRQRRMGRKENVDPLNVILLAGTLQHMYEHLDSLKNQVLANSHNIKLALINIHRLDSKIENLKTQAKSFMERMGSARRALTHEVDDLRDEVESNVGGLAKLEQKEAGIKNIQLIQPPSGGEKPIKPKTTLNVILGGVVGSFLMIFLAFFIEYIQKHRDTVHSLKSGGLRNSNG